jgi:hypothetical protein
MVEEYYHIARADLETAERAGRFKDVDLETAEDQHLIEQKVPFQQLQDRLANPTNSWFLQLCGCMCAAAAPRARMESACVSATTDY